MASQAGTTPAIVIIPARLASTRLPEKMLLRETGLSLLEHTWRQAIHASRPEEVYVATDNSQIAEEVHAFGGKTIDTSSRCRTGTDRVAEAARTTPSAGIIVNVQGDEPEIDPSTIDSLIERLEANSAANMATAATPIRDRTLWQDPACVKVVLDRHGRALYFSRSPLPHLRDEQPECWDDQEIPVHQHLGIYAYRRDFLLQMATWPSTPLEQAEKLEQLRALEHGEMIEVAIVPHAAPGIDTPADYAAFVARQRQRAA